MADAVEAGGLMGMDSGRFFGFVIGGALPAALAADWLVTAWDQNTGLFAPSPATSVIEEIAGRWMLDLLGLPPESSFAFVTGGQMANTTALAAARHHVLAAAGWDVEADGLAGSPPIRLVVGEEVHVTIPRAARFLGSWHRTRSSGSPSTPTVECCRPISNVCWRSSPVSRPSCVARPATSTRARSIRSASSPPSPTRTARGCTSTAPSGCGRRPAATSPASRASTRPIRGRPMRTSGSTFHTTAAS